MFPTKNLTIYIATINKWEEYNNKEIPIKEDLLRSRANFRQSFKGRPWPRVQREIQEAGPIRIRIITSIGIREKTCAEVFVRNSSTGMNSSVASLCATWKLSVFVHWTIETCHGHQVPVQAVKAMDGTNVVQFVCFLEDWIGLIFVFLKVFAYPAAHFRSAEWGRFRHEQSAWNCCCCSSKSFVGLGGFSSCIWKNFLLVGFYFWENQSENQGDNAVPIW